MSSITGHTFNISVITREHMGDYVCNANNGIPPASSKKFRLQIRCKHVAIYLKGKLYSNNFSFFMYTFFYYLQYSYTS